MKSLNPRQLPALQSNNPPPPEVEEVKLPQDEAIPEPEAKAESQPTSIELEHLESIEIDAGLKTAFAEGSSESIGHGEVPPEYLNKDQFFQHVFLPAHAIPGAMLQLKSLPVQANEMDAARQACDAIYDTITETPMLHFLIKPGNIWVQRALVIYAYAAPKMAAVQLEIRMRDATDVTKAGSHE